MMALSAALAVACRLADGQRKDQTEVGAHRGVFARFAGQYLDRRAVMRLACASEDEGA